MASDLTAVAIVEQDTNGNDLVVWSYPTVGEDMEQALMARSELDAVAGAPDGTPATVFFGKHAGEWHYTLATGEALPSLVLPKIRAFSVSLISKSFNPERYAALLEVLAPAYAATGDPTSVLEGYLSIFTTGAIVTKNGRLDLADAKYDPKRALLSNCSLKDLHRLFGLESVLIWNAMMLKKRVVVYGDALGDLQRICRVLPQLVWHRQDWGILRPCVKMNDVELGELASAGVYCAAFTDPEVRAREDLYDLFVDLSARSITIADHAAADMKLCPLHKDMANLFAKACEEADGDQAVVKAVARKVMEVVGELKKLAGDEGITAAKFPPHMKPALRAFLYNLAVAESLVVDG